MSDKPEALRVADLLQDDWGTQEAVTELRRQHDEIEQLKAERDALLAEVERLKNVCIDLTGQLMVLRATKQMAAAIDAARDAT